MVSPSPLKKYLKPKTHEGTGLKAHEAEGRKEKALPTKINKRESSGKNWAGIPRGCQGLEILETCNTARMRLRQLKKSTKKHKERRTDTSFSITQ